MTESSASGPENLATLRAALTPILARLADLHPQDKTTDDEVRAVEAALNDAFPTDGEAIAALGALVERGIAEGWLCDRGPETARFSRIAKPSPDTHQFSIDCVSMIGTALDHTHVEGEVTIGFAAAGETADNVRFEGRPAGWVFLPPGSRHAPRVDGGRMNLVYFLPNGAVQWHR